MAEQAQQQQTTSTATAATTDGSADTAAQQQQQDLDLEALLVRDGNGTTPPAATTTEQVAKATEVPAKKAEADTGNDVGAASADAGDAAATAAATTGKPPETQHQPGTSDKALQKVQQDLAAAVRQVNDLAQKVNDGGKLTGAEQQKLEAARQRLDRITGKLRDKKFDAVEDGDDLAETVLEAHGLAQSQAKTIGTLQERLAQTEEQLAEIRADRTFKAMEEQYPGVKVRDVWQKAVDDAAAVIGDDNPKLGNLASKLFHERAGAAAKRTTAPPAKETTTTATTTKKPTAPTPITPGGAKVQQADTGVIPTRPLSEDEEYVQAAMSLVKK